MGIKKPPAYIHPAKRKRSISTDEPPTQVRVETLERPLKKKEERNDGRNGSSRKAISHSSGVVRVRVVAYAPQPGQLKRYDEMVASGINSKVALLGLLRKAKADIGNLAAQSPKSIGRLDYEFGDEFVETNWSVPSAIADQLITLFDPFGILTPRACGTKIGSALVMLADKDRAND